LNDGYVPFADFKHSRKYVRKHLYTQFNFYQEYENLSSI
jgi:hypothetical protein